MIVSKVFFFLLCNLKIVILKNDFYILKSILPIYYFYLYVQNNQTTNVRTNILVY